MLLFACIEVRVDLQIVLFEGAIMADIVIQWGVWRGGLMESIHTVFKLIGHIF